MIQRQTAALIGLTALVLVLTGFAVRGSGSTGFLGVVAPVIVPALLTWLLIMVLAYGKAISEILAAILLTRPKEEGGHRKSLLATIIAWVIVIALASLLTRPEFSKSLSGALQQVAGFFATRLGISPPATSPVVPLSSTNGLLFYYTLIIFVGIIIVSFSLLFASFYKAYKYARAIPSDADVALRKEISHTLREARANLEDGGRYHEVILNCYRKMCAILSDRGFLISPTQTAREFGENVSRKLELGGDSVSGLTFLFEEARYSDHLIEDQKRHLAMDYLNSLERVFTGVGVKS